MALVVDAFSVVAVAALASLRPIVVRADEPPPSASFTALARVCAPHVDVTTLAALVRVESGFNPYAIGVVGNHLQYQPTSYAQALATAQTLVARGYNFSVGLGQVNVHNLTRVGENLSTIFDPCRNLRASSQILQQCFVRASAHSGDTQGALRDALSCYYSGNFLTGYRQGYVAKIIAGAYANWRVANGFERRSDNRTDKVRASAAPQVKNVSVSTSSHCDANITQSVTVRCSHDSHRWCTRCISTSTAAARDGLVVTR
ncbi:hypothetical protein BWP39_22755 [Paraburkholderia acidicola]|uniref:Transglycosylase SLT domain-containing protein n=1 Tax=Paraburkholderia acidicola TaxID=1912599 RepID=A0A2A4EPZ2_9BURK|nr:hypothetical protein BWP39_22755 [Paraburkholderia acidicola]